MAGDPRQMDHLPFHEDEIAAQALAGTGASGAGIRPFMTDQHRRFFPLLDYVFVAAEDARGWPLATILTGSAGFAHAPSPTLLRIDALPSPGDPAEPGIAVGRDVGILGLDLSTRRRNRANGRVDA